MVRAFALRYRLPEIPGRIGLSCRLLLRPGRSHGDSMTLPTEPVTLTPAQIGELNQRLSNLRHDINNHLSLMLAAVELIRSKPQMAERMMATLVEQPPKITEALQKFSRDFEQALGIRRDTSGARNHATASPV